MLFNDCLAIFCAALLFTLFRGVLAGKAQTLEGGTDRLFGGSMKTTLTRKFSRRELALVFLGVLATPGFAAPDPAERYVGKIADEVMNLANGSARGDALRGKFASLLNRYINLQGIANFALGPYRKQLPAGDKAEFYNLFSNYAAALFVYYVDEFQGTSLDIVSNDKQGNYTTIDSAIILKGGGRQKVKWRLVPAGGGYKISDINIKGVWLTIATKDRFHKVLNGSKGDFGALFAELKSAETW
jgi:phospholipid transport system substrate-binding protein